LSVQDNPTDDRRICSNRQKIDLSVVFAGQRVGIKQVSEHIVTSTRPAADPDIQPPTQHCRISHDRQPFVETFAEAAGTSRERQVTNS
jgi:hypothetical protein